MASRSASASAPPPLSETAKLTFAIEMLTKSIERLDRALATLRPDARTDVRITFSAITATALA